MSRQRLTRSATLALALAALAAPTAAAQQQDLRSPDARDVAHAAQASTDLRSPDARDAADGRGTFNARDLAVVKVPLPAPPAAGIDWGDAGFGAGAAFGLTLLAFGGTLAVTHRKRVGRQTATTS